MKFKSAVFLSIVNAFFPEDKSFCNEKFFIKSGYVDRKSYTHYDDTPLKDEFQNEVYQVAERVLKSQNGNKIAAR